MWNRQTRNQFCFGSGRRAAKKKKKKIEPWRILLLNTPESNFLLEAQQIFCLLHAPVLWQPWRLSKSYREDTRYHFDFLIGVSVITKTNWGNKRSQTTQVESASPGLKVSGAPKFCVRFNNQWCGFPRHFHVLRWQCALSFLLLLFQETKNWNKFSPSSLNEAPR